MIAEWWMNVSTNPGVQKFPQRVLKTIWEANSIIKSKGHAWQVRGKVVETVIAGLGYKKISQALNVLWSAAKSIVWK